jgi:peroxiredoxin
MSRLGGDHQRAAELFDGDPATPPTGRRNDMLEPELAAQRERAYEKRSPAERAVRAAAIEAVSASGVAKSALGVGDVSPSFTLPHADGTPVVLSELLHSGPVVLCFYRGGWCPYCNLELRAYQQRLGDIERLGATLIAISPELPDRTLSTKEKNELAFPVLSDHGNAVAQHFRITHLIDPAVSHYQLGNGNNVAQINGSAVAEVPVPATYVVDTAGVIRFAFVNADYTARAEPDDVLACLAELAGARAGISGRERR